MARSALRPPVVAMALAAALCACGHSGAAPLEGKWKGRSVEGVPADLQPAANAFAEGTEIEVKGSTITVTTPHDKQAGTYRVVKQDKAQVVIVTDRDGPDDAQTFTLVDDRTMKWNVLDGKTITFARAR